MILSVLSLAFSIAAGPTFHSLNAHVLPPDKPDFTFIVIGDNRPAGAGLPPTPTYRRLMADIATIGPSFVISSGDLVYGNEESVDQYKKECAGLKPIMDSLPCPFFNAPGNHELNERADFQAAYESAFGALRGAFTYGGCRFIAACSDEVGHPDSFSPDDAEFLDHELEFAGPKVVYFHHPIFARQSNTEGNHTLEDAEAWHRKFVAAGVSEVFEGHDHVLNHQSHDGVDYWISGGGGAPLDTTPDDGGYHHFLLIHVSNGKFNVDIIPEGALDIDNSKPGRAVIANYATVNLTLTNLKMKVSGPSAHLKANFDKKGKLTPIDVKMTGYDSGTHIATVSVVATKARKTTVEEE